MSLRLLTGLVILLILNGANAERLDTKQPHLANKDIDILSYDISLKLEKFERADIQAQAKIYMNHLKYESSVDLHIEGTALSIKNVSDNLGRKYNFSIIKGIPGKPRKAMESFETGKKNNIVVLSGDILRIHLPFFNRFPQRRLFSISYTIKAESLKHDRGAMLTKWYSLKQFNMRAWPYFARYIVPSNDHPNDTAKVSFDITVPKDMTVGAVGELISNTTSSNYANYKWRQSNPIPTYGMHFAAGNFDTYTRDICFSNNATNTDLQETTCSEETEKVPLLYHHPKSIMTPDGTEYVPLYIEQVEKSANSLIFLSKFLGKYEYSKLGFVTTQYPFSMETASYMTLRSPESAVHEVVHNWWGNAVYFKHWGDFWISEGITTYYSGLYDEFLTGKNSSRFLVDGVPDGTLRNSEDTDPLDIFDDVPYQRGAAAIHDLRKEIATLTKLELMGADQVELTLFLKFMRSLYQEFKFKLLDTDLLISFIHQKLPSFLEKEGFEISKDEIIVAINRWQKSWF